MALSSGLFISLEGIDGSGKTTQSSAIYDYLTANGIHCLITKEPNNLTIQKYANTSDKRSISQIVRELVYAKEEVDPVVELTLIYAARLEHVMEIIIPAMQSNKVVVCDRFFDSSITYLGYRIGKDKATKIVESLHKTLIPEELMPDITLLLDIDETDSQQRLSMRREENRLNEKITIKICKPFMELEKDNHEYKEICKILGCESTHQFFSCGRSDLPSPQAWEVTLEQFGRLKEISPGRFEEASNALQKPLFDKYDLVSIESIKSMRDIFLSISLSPKYKPRFCYINGRLAKKDVTASILKSLATRLLNAKTDFSQKNALIESVINACNKN